MALRRGAGIQISSILQITARCRKGHWYVNNKVRPFAGSSSAVRDYDGTLTKLFIRSLVGFSSSLILCLGQWNYLVFKVQSSRGDGCLVLEPEWVVLECLRRACGLNRADGCFIYSWKCQECTLLWGDEILLRGEFDHVGFCEAIDYLDTLFKRGYSSINL